MQCTALMTHPSWSARIWTSGPGTKYGQHQPDFQVPLGSLATDRNPFLCGHWDGKGLCKNIDCHHFFQTNTMALHHVLWLGQIVPESNISCRCVQTSSTNGVGNHLNHSLNGVSSVTLITCSVEWVQSSSRDSKEKMSWYSTRREWAGSASSGSQDPRPLKSNFLNTFYCLCSMVIFGAWMPWTSSNASTMTGHISTSGMLLAAITLAMEIFFFRVWG